ncbi:phosphate acyltransferase [Ureaplasma canigenitalium]|uniref:phosphate acyltransferase n=1 Tax=Ureaplasma canigenitalium TaxID=42092 RepID=UPI00068A883E|nr:phosphate acyltransferase [Ureaplasma canigenitalium]
MDLLNRIKAEITHLGSIFIRVLLIEDSDEIKKVKEVIKKDPYLSLVQLDFFRTEKIINECCQLYYEMRKDKDGISFEDAKKIVTNDNLTFAVLLTNLNYVDVFVVGKETSSKECFTKILRIIKPAPGLRCSATMALIKQQKIIFLSDVALNLKVEKDDIYDIARASVGIAKNIFNIKENHVVCASYVSDIIIDEKYNDYNLLGYLQYDAIVDLNVRKKKLQKVINYEFNHIIFQNIETANTVYKLMNKQLDYQAVGTFINYLNKSIGMVSRSATVEELILTIYCLVLDYLKRYQNENKK